jgi:hypothetical protein|tara:strand:+ start:39 stop:326 length:288 start_codon:yes stop_codon:yes gene_type:complete
MATRKYTRRNNGRTSSRIKEQWADPEWRAKTTAAIQAASDRRKKRGESLGEAASRLGVWGDDRFETREEAGRYVRKTVDGMSNAELNALSDKGAI